MTDQTRSLDEKALLAAEKAYREHIDGRPMVYAIKAYKTIEHKALQGRYAELAEKRRPK